jgi:hypothetical protein
MEDDNIFYGHLVHFTVFCYILWTYGIVRGNLVYFSRFGILYQEKSGNPGLNVWMYLQTRGILLYTTWRVHFVIIENVCSVNTNKQVNLLIVAGNTCSSFKNLTSCLVDRICDCRYMHLGDQGCQMLYIFSNQKSKFG